MKRIEKGLIILNIIIIVIRNTRFLDTLQTRGACEKMESASITNVVLFFTQLLIKQSRVCLCILRTLPINFLHCVTLNTKIFLSIISLLKIHSLRLNNNFSTIIVVINYLLQERNVALVSSHPNLILLL